MANAAAISRKGFWRTRGLDALAAKPAEHGARLLGLLCLAMGGLVLSTAWLLTPAEANHVELAAAGIGVVLLGAPLLVLPLDRLRRLNLLWPVAGTLVWMGFVNHGVTGALGPYRHIYVLIFAFVGLTQRRRTSLILLPLAVVTYLLPELGNEDRSLTVVGVVVAAPVWLLTAEILAAGTDLLKKANVALEVRNAEVKQYAEFQRDFVATASHELRTPITSIAGYVELLQEDSTLSREQLDHVRVIARNTGRLERLVHDLLTVNKGEAGHLAPRAAETNVEGVIDAVVDAYSGVCDRKGIRLSAACPEGLPVVFVDRDQTEQVLGNLINNAVKFSRAGGTIDVAALPRAGFVDVTIADDGVGIPADEVPRVFDRFFRSSTSIEMAVPGTGLGLAIAKAMIESQGGTIAVESVVGRGTTFTLSLPTERD